MTINRSDLLLVSQGQNVTVGVGEILDAAASAGSSVTSVNGETGDVVLTASDVGAPSSDAAAVASLTDNSSGTSGGNTIAAVTDVASAADAIATLAAKVNALLVSLRASGVLAS